MPTLSAPDVLDLWERGSTCPPVERALAILAATSPGTSLAQWGALTVGECEARLLALHEALFGSRLNGFARCPRCAEALELCVEIAQLRATVPDESPVPTDVLVLRGYRVEFRLLSALDLADAAACTSVPAARAVLLERAVVSATRGGRSIAPERMPRALVERLAQQLMERDPWAESLLELVCPACRHQWTVLLDVAAFLWTEIRTRAQRLVREVHALAQGYGWREADILALSSRRRAAYLELLGA